MRTTILWGLLAILAAWLPGGLIHQGQRTANPRAESILGQLLTRANLITGCDRATAEWRGRR
jgi:hypothetical protein